MTTTKTTKTTTTIFRMETPKGEGPFCGVLDSEEFAHAVGWLEPFEEGVKVKDPNDKTHPHHVTDCIKSHGLLDPDQALIMNLLGLPARIPGEWLVGCDSLEELLHWFPAQSLEWFDKQGMVVSTYKVPEEDVLAGRYQVMFKKEKAKLVKREVPSSLATQIKIQVAA